MAQSSSTMSRSAFSGVLVKQMRLQARITRVGSGAIVKAQDGYRRVNGYNYSGSSSKPKDWDSLAAEEYSSVEPFFPEYEPTAADNPPSYTPPNVDRREPNYPDYTKDIDSLVGYGSYAQEPDRYTTYRQDDQVSEYRSYGAEGDKVASSYQDKDRYSSYESDRFASYDYTRDGPSSAAYSATTEQPKYQSESFGLPSDATPPIQPSTAASQGEAPTGFTGSLPELLNGRLAMVGFFAGMCAELATGEPVYYQLWEATGPITLTIIALTAASLVPTLRGVRYEGVGFMTPSVELINARAAMVGFALLVLIESTSGQALFH